MVSALDPKKVNMIKSNDVGVRKVTKINDSLSYHMDGANHTEEKDANIN
jgi:hypothetical protein